MLGLRRGEDQAEDISVPGSLWSSWEGSVLDAVGSEPPGAPNLQILQAH